MYDFLHVLNESRYGTFKNDLLNDVVKGAIGMPATLSGLYTILINYIVPKSSQNRVGTGGAVFATRQWQNGDLEARKIITVEQKSEKKGKRTGSKKAVICEECNEPGHKRDECQQLGDDDDAAVSMVYCGIYMTHACLFEPNEELLDNQADVSIVSELFLTDIRRVCRRLLLDYRDTESSWQGRALSWDSLIVMYVPMTVIR